MNTKKFLLAAAALFVAVGATYAQGNGQAGITEATNLITGYFDPGTKLVYAIGAVCGLIGGVKGYNKFSSGDPDTSKVAASWFGACIFLIVAATIFRSFFCKYSINSLVYWVTYVHNVVYSFYRSMIYCYINSTQRCAGSIVIDIIPTNGADKRKFFPFAPYFPVTNVIKRYFYPYFPAIIGIKGYSFPYFPYLSGIMKIKTALYSLFSRLDWYKTVVFACLGGIYEGIRSLSWEIPVA